MKKIFALPLLLFIFSCNNSEKSAGVKQSVTDMDAARNFLEASLKGEYKEASTYMLQDSTNTGYLFYAERDYNKLNAEDKRELKESSLRFYEPTERPNDSTTILIFSNSFRNDKDTLKIIKAQGKWLVDLKYLFLHDNDTTLYKSGKNSSKDSLDK